MAVGISLRSLLSLNPMKKILSVLLLFFAMAAPATATAQFQERITIDGGQEAGITVLPLEPYLAVPDNAQRFRPYQQEGAGCTALWRNYLGSWEIKDQKLYLTKFEINACSQERKKSIPLDKLFPGKSQPVLADWFSGYLVIPQGKLLQYVHMGYESRYERYLIIHIVQGNVKKRETLTDKAYQRRRHTFYDKRCELDIDR
jgi:hypothetical protein